AAAQTERQGEGGGWGAGCAALDLGAPAQSGIPFIGGAERPHPGAAHRAQRSQDASLRGKSSRAIRATRPSRLTPTAHVAVSIRAVAHQQEAGNRLSRRCRGTLLLRSPRAA